MHTSSKIEKLDARGHMRRSSDRRQELLAEFDQSGLSAPEFCALTGVKYQTLMGWLQRRRLQAKKIQVQPLPAPKALPPVPNPLWIEAVVEKTPGVFSSQVKTGITIRLLSGAEINLSSVEQAPLAAAVLRSLRNSHVKFFRQSQNLRGIATL